MSSQSTGDFGVPLLKHWCKVQMLTLRGVPKLDLMHCSYYYYIFLKKKHPCKYFSVLQKKVCTVLLGGHVLLHFFLKVWRCPKTWNVFFFSAVVVVVLRSKCMIVCYSLRISPIFLKIILAHCSLWVVLDGTSIYLRCSDRYSHIRTLHLKL